MKINIIKSLSIIVSVLLLTFPVISFGQTEDFVQPAETETMVEIPEIEIEINIEENAPAGATQLVEIISQDGTTPQNTDKVQTIDTGGAALEPTVDPHDTSIATTTSPINIPVDTGTSTPPVILPDPEPVIEPEIVVQETVTITEVMPEVAQMDREEVVKVIEAPTILTAKPNPEFTFRVISNAIPTKALPEWQKTDKEKKAKTAGRQITATPNLSADNNEGVLNISGVCGEPYFVILIYTKPEDYDKSPGSYIFNKAFDCVGGKYFYELAELPESLSDGTYYLLVAGQGNTGSWKPITALIPITIQNEHDE